MDTYQVYDLDILPDGDGGWDLNNWYKRGTIETPEVFTDAELIEILANEGYVDPLKYRRIHVQNDQNGWVQIQDKLDNYKPVYNLELIRPW